MFPDLQAGLVVVLLAVVVALGFCLALTWTQFLKLAASQKRLREQVKNQLGEQFLVLNDKLSAQTATFKRDAAGAEQKLESAFQRRLQELEALATSLRVIERKLQQEMNSRSASGYIAELKETVPAFEILEGGRKRSETTASASPEDQPSLPSAAKRP